MSQSSAWVAWVGAARKGDAEAIDQLSAYFAPFIHAVLVSRLSHQLAGSLVKPVLTQAMYRLAGLSNDAGFGNWVLIAAREKAFDAAKAPGSTVDQPGADPMINGGHGVLARIRQLSESSRERLAMRLLEGIPGGEIAEVLSVKETEVRGELERAAAIIVQQLTGKSVSFTGDAYLWSLMGAPHETIIPLENQLTALRYDPSVDPEMTPLRSTPIARIKAPEGRRQTSASLKPLQAESTDPSGSELSPSGIHEDDEATRPVRRPSMASLLRASATGIPQQSAGAPDPSNPFGTSVKTIHVSDLPAAADFADLHGAGPADDDPSTLVSSVPDSTGLAPALTRQAPKVEQEPAQAYASYSEPHGRSLASSEEEDTGESTGLIENSKARLKTAPIPVGHGEEDPHTAVNPAVPTNWRSAGMLGRPAPMQTVMGLPAVMVKRGSLARSWRPFGVAAALALVGIGVALLVFDGAKRRVRSGWTLVPVVVAATDLAEGTVVTIEMVSQRSVPEAFVTSSVIKPDSLSYVVNQKILVGAQAGDPLLWSQFEIAAAGERLSKKVMRRARAFDLMTSKTIAVGGWVQPNDRIDIIASLKANDKGERVAITLLQDVPVLSTGKITSSTTNSARRDGDKDYIDLSVLLLPEETELIALATEVGDLQFTLRTDDDHDTLTDHRGSASTTLLQGERVRLLQLKRMKTIQQIRNPPPTH